MTQAPDKNCPKCSKPLAAAGRAGSLTSFLFSDLHCQCDRASAAGRQPVDADRQSCKRCGKVVSGPRRLGSFTGFLLSDLRCKCREPLIQTPAKTAALETRYVPPQAARQKRMRDQATMRRTRTELLQQKDAELVSLAPGQIIGGCYELIALIGKGGMGLVYKARHTTLRRICALKFLAPSMVSPASWQLFQKEAQILSSLTHPTICHIYDLGIHAGSLPFYAMDYLAGSTVDDVITSDGPLSVGATLEVAIKVAEGLSYAHRRSIVHKDIKPANIMLVPGVQDTIDVKLLDFGIAQLAETSGNSRGTTVETSEIIGSAAYMSPEQFEGNLLDLRSDIYSLGCTIFETLTGSTPYDDEDFDRLGDLHIKSEIPRLKDVTGIDYALELEAVVLKCLQKHPDNRYQNANELAIDLQRVLDQKELQFARPELQSLVIRANPDVVIATTGTATTTVALSTVGVATIVILGAGMIYLGVDLNAKLSSKPAVDSKGKILRAEDKVLQTSTQQPIGSDDGTMFFKTAEKVVKPNQNKPASQLEEATDLPFADQLVGFMPPAKEDLYNFPGQTKPFYVGTTKDKTGKLKRCFNFQSKVPLGSLQWYDDIKHPAKSSSYDCKGQVLVPMEGDLCFVGSKTIANLDAVLACFSDQDLAGIDLCNLVYNGDQVVKAIARFPHLRFIGLNSFEQHKGTSDIVAGAKNLYFLHLLDWHNNAPNPLAIDKDVHLTKIDLGHCRGSLHSFFAVAPEENSLKIIILDSIPVSKADIDYLSRMQNLEELSLSFTNINSDSISELPRLRHLRRLVINDPLGSMTTRDIKTFASMKTLKYLQIQLEQGDIERKQLEFQLRQALPGATVKFG